MSLSVVIGAGPAGSIAARDLAKRGRRVLLVDKSKFPRPKVCGCCLSARALAVLERVGLGGVVARLGARPIDSLELVSERGRRARVRLGGGVSLSRSSLDLALIEEAVRAGVEFVPECAATVGPISGPSRLVRVGAKEHAADLVIVADGLAGTSLKEVPGFEPEVAAGTRVGIAGVLERGPFTRAAITMVCGRWGYVGAVWLEDGRVDIAGAVDAMWMKQVGGPSGAVARIFADAGLAVPGLAEAAWRGTPGLTRRRSVEAKRLVVIGDAAGYVEPFTGEGMAWAMMCGEAVGRVVDSGVSWTRAHRGLIGRRQRDCRWVARLLRNPALCSMAIGVLAAVPALAGPIVRRISMPESRSTPEITPS